MTDGFDAPQKEWSCGWDSHRHAQALRLSRLPFSEKLKWLEQAQRLLGRLAGGAFEVREKFAGKNKKRGREL